MELRFSRRSLLLASPALLLPSKAMASTDEASISIPSGWNTLPGGAGGLVTGLSIANDGSMVCRTDVGNIYRWSGKTTDYADGSKTWQQLLTFSSLGGSASFATSSDDLGGWEHVLAPGNSAVHLAVFYDTTLNDGSTDRLWYSTNSGVTWNRSSLSFAKGVTNSNAAPDKTSFYKVAVDPVNENVAYCVAPFNSGNSAGAYTSLNQSGGSTLATFSAVKTDGVAALPATTTGHYCGGVSIDPSSNGGTTTVGGQTVSKHIIIPVGGRGIYESTDGGVTFAEIAVSLFRYLRFLGDVGRL